MEMEMEMEMENQLPSMWFFFSVILSIFTFLQLRKTFQHSKNAINLPPGPRKFPLIGNIHNLVGAMPHHALQKLSSKYGDVMHLQFGELSLVVISSPDAAKQIMKTHDLNFASRPPILVAEIASYNCKSITFGPYGEYWRQLRKICTLELLSMKRVKSFRPIREKVYDDLISRIAFEEGTEVNLTDKLYAATYAVISMAAVGNMGQKNEKLVSLIEELTRMASGFYIGDLYPSVKLIQWMSGMRSKLEKLLRETDKILEEIIREHRLNKKNGEGGQQEDLVDVLLKFQAEGLEIPLTNDSIKAVILDIVGAGSETSATVINWAMVEMLNNPTVLEKAQHEVREAFDAKGYVDESLVHELKYLNSVIKETLRHHTPVPLLLPRICGQKCEINGYDIPVDTKIIINAWAIARDSKYWKDGECFKPERFLDNMVDYKGNNYEFTPFGSGRRICPGISFGFTNVEVAKFLYHLDWKLPIGMAPGEMDMTEVMGASARRKKDLWAVPLVNRPLLNKQY